MESLDGAGVLSDLNRLVHGRGFAGITTAAVVTYDISDSKLYYSNAGHPPVLVHVSGGRWLPLLSKHNQTDPTFLWGFSPPVTTIKTKFASTQEIGSSSIPMAFRRRLTRNPMKSSEKGKCPPC
jgi:hypothetical protein